jgi:hypothetical protein
MLVLMAALSALTGGVGVPALSAQTGDAPPQFFTYQLMAQDAAEYSPGPQVRRRRAVRRPVPRISAEAVSHARTPARARTTAMAT